MAEEPIYCPECEETNWEHEWSGRFTENVTIIWQTHIPEPRYETQFEDMDQYDTESELWRCRNCHHVPDDALQDTLFALHR